MYLSKMKTLTQRQLEWLNLLADKIEKSTLTLDEKLEMLKIINLTIENK